MSFKVSKAPWVITVLPHFKGMDSPIPPELGGGEGKWTPGEGGGRGKRISRAYFDNKTDFTDHVPPLFTLTDPFSFLTTVEELISVTNILLY